MKFTVGPVQIDIAIIASTGESSISRAGQVTLVLVLQLGILDIIIIVAGAARATATTKATEDSSI